MSCRYCLLEKAAFSTFNVTQKNLTENDPYFAPFHITFSLTSLLMVLALNIEKEKKKKFSTTSSYQPFFDR